MHFKTFLLIATVAIITACQSTKVEKNSKLISVSILPQRYFIERIAGKDFEVNVLIPPGASPETYEPTPIQMKQVAKSIAYFKIGHIPFEKTWLNNLVQEAGDIKISDLSQGIELLQAEEEQHGDHFHEGGVDPHIWSSLKSVKIITRNLFDELILLAPEKKSIYENNYKHFLSEIEALDQASEIEFSNLKNKSFMIFHPALSYLARDYGLRQISIESDGKEPSPAHMQHLISQAKEDGIKIIFVQKQFNIENAKTVAKEIGAEVIQIDPLNEDWLTEIKQIINYLQNK